MAQDKGKVFSFEILEVGTELIEKPTQWDAHFHLFFPNKNDAV